MTRFTRDERAVSSPIPVLMIIVATLAFEGLLFGTDLAAASFPTIESPSFDIQDCQDGTIPFFSQLDDIACVIGSAFLFAAKFLQAIFLTLFGVVVFLFNLISFNVPGAPWYVRLVVGSAFGGAIMWAVAGLFRGN